MKGLGDGIELQLTHVFDVRIDFATRLVFGPVSGGAKQGFVSVAGGIVSGPRLDGRVLPASGADWGTVRTDGVLEANAHYMLEARDGTPIYIHNRGYVYNTQPGASGPPYFRCTPYFRAPVGPHDWLNRTVIVGGGQRHTNPDHTLFRYFAVD